jgi:hypothetical protein
MLSRSPFSSCSKTHGTTGCIARVTLPGCTRMCTRFAFFPPDSPLSAHNPLLLAGPPHLLRPIRSRRRVRSSRRSPRSRSRNRPCAFAFLLCKRRKHAHRHVRPSTSLLILHSFDDSACVDDRSRTDSYSHLEQHVHLDRASPFPSYRLALRIRYAVRTAQMVPDVGGSRRAFSFSFLSPVPSRLFSVLFSSLLPVSALFRLYTDAIRSSRQHHDYRRSPRPHLSFLLPFSFY